MMVLKRICLLRCSRLQPAIVQKQRMAKLRAPQRPMTAGFASVKEGLDSFTAPVFMLELFSGGRVVINDCVIAL